MRKGGEVVFDFEITPNRADCLGILGIAREVSVLYNENLKTPKPFGETYLSKKRRIVNLKVEGKDLCPYYTLGIIDNVKVQESPEWLKKRLKLAEIRPINNIVDITNYVMMETSQPMHAFDLDKIKGNLILRKSREGEKITTLDGIMRTLNKGALIIEDSEKLIDLAGLMGGLNSQVDESTKTVLLHVPVYNSVAIRRASQYTNLRSEASNRFEKKLDPNAHRYAFERALHIMKLEAGGILTSDIKSVGYPFKSEPFNISVRRIQSILGIDVGEKEIIEILSGLGFEIMPSPSLEDKQLEVRPPTWRLDVKITEDVAEEVGRIWGYNKFPKTLPKGYIPTHEDSFSPDWGRRLRNSLQSIGFNEIYSHSMTDIDSIGKINLPPTMVLKVQNRMTVDYEYMRPTLLIGLLQAVQTNLRNFDNVSLFELGRVFNKSINPKTKLPYQPRKISAVTTEGSFSEIKGIVQKLLKDVGVVDYTFENAKPDYIWSDTSATLKVQGEEIGNLGSLNSKILANFSIKREAFGFELDFEKLIEKANSDIKYREIPVFPIIKEDLSVVIEKNTQVSKLLEIIHNIKEPKIKGFEIKEIIPWQGKKSILLSFEYYDPRKTLTDREAEQIRKKIVAILKNKLAAEIRSK